MSADYGMYSRSVADEGVLALHDVLPHAQVPDCQVYRLWAELQDSGKEHMDSADPEDDGGWGQWGGRRS